MPTISYVSIRRQGRVLFFWLKLLFLSCERLCRPSYSQHCSANTFFIAGFPQPDKQLFCARVTVLQHPGTAAGITIPRAWTGSLAVSEVLRTLWFQEPRSDEHKELLPSQTPRWSLTPAQSCSVCSENVSLHSISFVNRARSSRTKYCNDSD